MEDSGVEGIRISEGSGSGLGRDSQRVASKEIGEKVIVCGKAAKWWDAKIKEKIRLRRQVYKEISSGREDKWGEYYKLRSEIKELVCKKKLDSWNEMIEKANKDFYENRKDRVLGICWQDFNR